MVSFASSFVQPKPRSNRRAVRRPARSRRYTDAKEREAAMKEWRDSLNLKRGTVRDLSITSSIAKVAGVDHVGIGSDFDGVPDAARAARRRRALSVRHARTARPRLVRERHPQGSRRQHPATARPKRVAHVCSHANATLYGGGLRTPYCAYVSGRVSPRAAYSRALGVLVDDVHLHEVELDVLRRRHGRERDGN